jgi:hypothetical protein
VRRAWDVDMTLATFEERLVDPDPEVRGYFLGKLMRQAKPDDVLAMVTLARIASEWASLEPYLGDAKPLWEWLVGRSPAEAPREVLLEGRALRIDTPHQILVDKLCAMLTRSEVRDLRDVDALLALGGDLSRALQDAPHQDMGFSAITLAWTLRRWPLGKLAAALGESDIEALETMRERLVERLLVLAVPS